MRTNLSRTFLIRYATFVVLVLFKIVTINIILRTYKTSGQVGKRNKSISLFFYIHNAQLNESKRALSSVKTNESRIFQNIVHYYIKKNARRISLLKLLI